MRIFAAFMATETNTFAPAPTGWGGWRENGLYRGDASRRDPQGLGMTMAHLRRRLEAEGHELVESISAFAQPLGRTVQEVYESLRTEILTDLQAAGPIDAVVLVLHGAMVSERCDDCEGHLIAAVRSIVGPEVPIGVELDLHCHYTERMHRTADVIVAYKEYPHVDALPRLDELLRIVLDTARGRVRPTTAVFDCRMVGMWHTTREPMAGFVRAMQEVERQPGVLSVSLGHGFPWADVPESGAKIWVVTDRRPELAAALAEQLAREFWALRDRTTMPALALEEALERARAVRDGLVVLADIADNPGGGAMGDSTFVLRALLDRQVGDAALGMFWDPGAIHLCCDAGVGARIDLRLGGKCGPASGEPVDLRVTVCAIRHDFCQVGMNSSDEQSTLGTGVWVRGPNDLDIVLASVRSQVFSPGVFTALGIDLACKKLVAVKSSQHFHAQFAPIAKAVLYASTPGALSVDFATLPYRQRDLDYWPRVADPLGWERQSCA